MRIAEYWRQQVIADGRWMHPEDKDVLLRKRHPFNHDHPVSPFVGDLRAEVVILGANGGYSDATSLGFAGKRAVAEFLVQVAEGRNTRWAMHERYYQNRKYSAALEAGRVVIVNACAYRSRNRPDLERLRLPSVAFMKDWLLNAVGPLAHSREFREVVESARGLTGARYGVMVIVDETGAPLDSVFSGFPPEEQQELLHPSGLPPAVHSDPAASFLFFMTAGFAGAGR